MDQPVSRKRKKRRAALNVRNEAPIPACDTALWEQINQVNTKLTAYIQAIEQVALVSVTDKSGKIIYANEVFCEVSGYSQDELLGQNHRVLNSGHHPKAFFVNMWHEITHGRLWHEEICNRSKNGSLYWVDSTIVPLRNTDGQIDRYLSVRVDITANMEREGHLQKRLNARMCLFEMRREILQASQVGTLRNLILEKLVGAMQFSHLAVSSMLIDGKYYSSDTTMSPDTQHLPTLQGEIRSKHKVRGWIKVQYREPRPFLLPEEQDVIQSASEDFALWLERNETEEYVRYQANHDGLTQLPNRCHMKRILDRLIGERRHNIGRFAVLFIDLDHFKIINDSLGHETGDLLLKEVAKKLTSCVRKEDIVARQGGDEFIVLICNVNSYGDVETVAQKIVEQIKLPFTNNNSVLYIGASIGIAMFPDDGETVDTLLRSSDLAMYEVKQAGRNSYQFFSSEMNRLVVEGHRMKVALHEALNRHEFELYFQPIMDHSSQRIVSMEVLLRWRRAGNELVSPGKFIPLAEESGLIIPIGAWVLRAACQQIESWRRQGIEVPRLTVNLSMKQLGTKQFVHDVITILRETGVRADCITLEVTESMLAENTTDVAQKLHQLSSLGFHIAVDDFGTGYSCMALLKNYPIDLLKIDQTFVRNICADKNDAAIVIAIIAMAHGLGMRVVAEGVETPEQLDFLSEKNCDFYQGYLFYKPQPASDIVNSLRRSDVFVSLR